MPYSVKVVKNSKVFMLTVEPGMDVRIHDPNGDPSALSVLFKDGNALSKAIVGAPTPDDVAALVRRHAPDVWAFAVVPGRITLLLRMLDGDEVFLHKDADGSLSAHDAEFAKVAPESLFWEGVDDAIKQLAKAQYPIAMVDVLQNTGRSNVVSVSAPKPFPDHATAKGMDAALDIIEGMLKPGFDPREAHAFLLAKGRTVPIQRF